MNSPVIDVIIPVYNGEKFIAEAVASVQAQTLSDIRILIADDGSEDNTPKLVRDLSGTDERITVLSRPHTGVSATLNAAIRASCSEYIAFLDADDLWHEQKLELQMRTLQESGAQTCFCMIQEFESFEPGVPGSHRARAMPMRGISKTGFLGRRTLFETFGLFDEQIAIGDFVEWYSRLTRAEAASVMLHEVLAFRRVHHHNTTRNISGNAFLKLLKTHLDEKRR